MFWSRYNAIHRCRSLGVIGTGQQQVWPPCATWRITLAPPTSIHLLPQHTHADTRMQTHTHVVVVQGCSLKAEREKTGSWCGYINRTHTAQHFEFWFNCDAGRVWFGFGWPSWGLNKALGRENGCTWFCMVCDRSGENKVRKDRHKQVESDTGTERESVRDWEALFNKYTQSQAHARTPTVVGAPGLCKFKLL